jgi:hypothetical protein
MATCDQPIFLIREVFSEEKVDFCKLSIAIF